MIVRSTRDGGDEAGRRRPGGGSGLLVRVGFSIGFAVAAALSMGATQVLAYGNPLPCGARSEAPAFAAWGDKGSYFRISNGGFENGSADWALSGAATIAKGNEWYRVSGASDSHSLRLAPGGVAESRTLCVAQGEETVRLFVANYHVPGSILHVDAMVRNPATGQLGWAAFDVNGDVPSAFWSPTMKLSIPRMFGGSGTEELTLTFSVRGAPAYWFIDDVYIDPFKSW
jgi:hypothetical protein